MRYVAKSSLIGRWKGLLMNSQPLALRTTQPPPASQLEFASGKHLNEAAHSVGSCYPGSAAAVSGHVTTHRDENAPLTRIARRQSKTIITSNAGDLVSLM